MMTPIIVALDGHDRTQILSLAERLDPLKVRVKVGKELFTACPSILTDLQKLGFKIFLDLKYHDIPNTVASAVQAAADLGVWMVNVHASSGSRAMTQARQRLDAGGYDTRLIAVTVLTSMGASDAAEIGIDDLDHHVLRLAKLAHQSRLDGVVCSAFEARMIKDVCPNFITVCPGVRVDLTHAHDQTRVATDRKSVV